MSIWEKLKELFKKNKKHIIQFPVEEKQQEETTSVLERTIRERIVIARDETTEPRILDMLAEDEDIRVIYELALNVSTSSNTLDKLVNNYATNKIVQLLVAQNPSTSDYTLCRLANHETTTISGAAMAQIEFRKKSLNNVENQNTKSNLDNRQNIGDDDEER